MAMRSKRLEFTVSLDAAGTMRADGDAPLSPPAGWTSDHLLLAALVRCSLSSLRYHARRAGLALAISMAGGYARRIDDTVDIHFQTVAAASSL